jgi:hypothetical protein
LAKPFDSVDGLSLQRSRPPKLPDTSRGQGLRMLCEMGSGDPLAFVISCSKAAASCSSNAM